MKLRQTLSILSESPVGDMTFHGTTTPGSHNASDIGIFTSPKGQAKIRRVLEKAPIWIDLVMVNDPSPRRSVDPELSGDLPVPDYINRIGSYRGLQNNVFWKDRELRQIVASYTYAFSDDPSEIELRDAKAAMCNDSSKIDRMYALLRAPRVRYYEYDESGEVVAAVAKGKIPTNPNHSVKEIIPTRAEELAYKRAITKQSGYDKQLIEFVKVMKSLRAGDSDMFRHLKRYPDKNDPPRQPSYGILTPEEVFYLYGTKVDTNPDRLTLVLAFNEGDNAVPLTGWMIAHRLGHALEYVPSLELNTKMNRMLEEMIGSIGDRRITVLELSSLMHAVGTFKAASAGNIGNEGEFYLDCFAQYVTTGTIRFNPLPPTIPKIRFTRSSGSVSLDTPYTYSSSSIIHFNESMQYLSRKMQEYFATCLNQLPGKIVGF